MIVLFDADSLIFASCYRTRKNNEKHKDKYIRNINDATNKFDEQFMKIINDISEVYDVHSVITFNGSKGNFRKKITPVYKANRKKQDLPPLLHELHDYVKDNYNSVYGYGVETDDLVAKNWHEIQEQLGREEVLICSIDKDYKQFNCLIWNYHKKILLDISQQEALYNFYEQMITGDTADNVNYFKGKGKKFAQNYYKGCTTKYQYTKKLYQLFQQQYKSKAREKYIECYNLLKLRIK
jgi:5'-3' exonuclease